MRGEGQVGGVGGWESVGGVDGRSLGGVGGRSGWESVGGVGGRIVGGVGGWKSVGGSGRGRRVWEGRV